MSTPDFKTRIDSLEAEVGHLEKKVWFKDMLSFGTMAIIIGVPVVIGVALYLIKPSIIKDKDDDGETMDSVSKSKFLKWTILFTLIGWAVVYFGMMYLKSKGYLKQN